MTVSFLRTPNLFNIATGIKKGGSVISSEERMRVHPGTNKFETLCEIGATALKVSQLRNHIFSPGTSSLTSKIIGGFAAWGASYLLSAVVEDKSLKICEIANYTPHLLFISKVALTALECRLDPRMGVCTVGFLALNALCNANVISGDNAWFVKEKLPLAADITLLVLGDPLTKIASIVSLVRRARS